MFQKIPEVLKQICENTAEKQSEKSVSLFCTWSDVSGGSLQAAAKPLSGASGAAASFSSVIPTG